MRSEYDWKAFHEAFCVCRRCHRATVFVLSLRNYADRGVLADKGLLTLKVAVNGMMEIEGFISLKDAAGVNPPDHLPSEIEAAFKEGATCLAVNCANAAATMFRLCVDLATRDKLPPDGTPGINARQRRDLGLRLPWLFESKLLPEELRELSVCIKDDGNDGAHAGTLTQEDAVDLLDFTLALLSRIYTEPQRLLLAQSRRADRRAKKDG